MTDNSNPPRHFLFMPLMLSKHAGMDRGKISIRKRKTLTTGTAKNVCFDSTCSVQFTRIQNLPGLVKLKMTKRAPSKIFQDILSLFWNSSRLILFFPFYTSPHSHQQTNIHPFVAIPKAPQVPACHPATEAYELFWRFFLNTRLNLHVIRGGFDCIYICFNSPAESDIAVDIL